MRADTATRAEATREPPPPAPAPAPRPTAAQREAARTAEAELERLAAEARYHRDRLALYHAKLVSSKPTSAARLRELERTSSAADDRLAHARAT